MTSTAAGRTDWREYADTPPKSEGVYEWQVKSVACSQMVVRVLAHFRKRGAGYRDVLSPEFGHWDGYKIIVPSGTRWREPTTSVDLPKYRQELICVEGLDPSPCPFCRRQPKVKGVQRAMGGGIVISGDAHTFNSWWYECCSWAKSPHFSDPRELEGARRAALTAAQPTGAA